jgi:hypothetical protein
MYMYIVHTIMLILNFVMVWGYVYNNGLHDLFFFALLQLVYIVCIYTFSVL